MSVCASVPNSLPSPSDEWATYVKDLAPAGPDAFGWEELTSLSHATHAPDALRIVEDGCIVPGLIQEGPLATTRTRVNFFSPKYWGGGTRYGVVSFETDWLKLHTSGTRLYWLPVDSKYQVRQFRMLVTDRDVSKLPVQLYDPSVDDGPVRLIGGRWFWAEAYAAEFLLPDVVNLGEVNRVRFVEHRSPLCPRHPSDCPEYGGQGLTFGSRRFVAGLLGAGPSRFDHILKDDSNAISGPIFQALNRVVTALGALNEKHFTGSVSVGKQAEAIIKGASLLLSKLTSESTMSEVRELTALFSSQDSFLHTFDDVVQKSFNVPGYSCR